MARRLAALAIPLLAACGGEGDLPRCGTAADCPADTVCDVPVTGEKGVCVAPFDVAVTSPSAGAWVGAAGAEVVATVAVRASLPAPASLALRLDGAAAGSLARAGDGTYRGVLVPAAGVDRGGSISAVAAFDGGEAASLAIQIRIDSVPPTLASAAAACDATCFRDSALHVSATGAADAHLAGVSASLSLDGYAKEAPLAPTPPVAAADLDLGGWPFPMLHGTLTVRVTARDHAGNATSVEATVDATRVRWTYVAPAAVTSPAVLQDGTLAVGTAAALGTDQLRGIDPLTGQELWTRTLAPTGSTSGGTVSVAPSAGANGIYVGTDDGYAYAVAPDGSGVLNVPCGAGGAIAMPPAVDGVTSEVAYAASVGGYLVAFDQAAKCVPYMLSPPTSAVVGADGTIYVGTAAAHLLKLGFNGISFTPPAWDLPMGTDLSAPLALDASAQVLSASADGAATQVVRTTATGTASVLASPGGSVVGAPVVLAGGDVVVGDGTRAVHRYSPVGAERWTVRPTLDGVPGSPVVLAGGDALLVVPTQNGMVYAIDAQGRVLWSGSLTAGTELREANVRAIPGSPFSLAYFGSSIGRLYAVVVDGHLDASAPWPKAYHDPANTSNAAAPLP